MSEKYDKFLPALEALCREHGVQIAVSGSDALQIWPLKENEAEVLASGIEDKTEEMD